MPHGPILIISGTNRPDAYCLRVARILEGHYRREGVAVDFYTIADLPAEVFTPHAYAHKPAAFAPVQKRVLDCCGMHIVTPEYNGSFPGVLKVFIDMLKFPESFDHKPVAFVGLASGAWGGLRAVEQLQMVFGYRNAHVYPERVFIPAVREKFDAAGRLDSTLDHRLARQAGGFAHFIAALRPA